MEVEIRKELAIYLQKKVVSVVSETTFLFAGTSLQAVNNLTQNIVL
jgi:hypothetical protein